MRTGNGRKKKKRKVAQERRPYREADNERRPYRFYREADPGDARPGLDAAALKAAAHDLVVSLYHEGLLNRDHPGVAALHASEALGDSETRPAPPPRHAPPGAQNDTIADAIGHDIDGALGRLDIALARIGNALNRLGLHVDGPAARGGGDEVNGSDKDVPATALARLRANIHFISVCANIAERDAARLEKFV